MIPCEYKNIVIEDSQTDLLIYQKMASKSNISIYATIGDKHGCFEHRKEVTEMEYRVVLEPDQEDSGYVAHCPALPGCCSQGDTKEEALENIKEAIEAYIESLQKDSLPVPDDIKPEIMKVKIHG